MSNEKNSQNKSGELKKAEGDLPVNILIVADEPRPDRAGGCRLPASVGGNPAG